MRLDLEGTIQRLYANAQWWPSCGMVEYTPPRTRSIGTAKLGYAPGLLRVHFMHPYTALEVELGICSSAMMLIVTMDEHFTVKITANSHPELFAEAAHRCPWAMDVVTETIDDLTRFMHTVCGP